MDDDVRAAMARWPDVPAARGWLALTARGEWRLRGEPIGNAALRAFIDRNYLGDADGRWFFQNGPQRVYAALEAAPWVVRLGPDGATTHTGVPVRQVSGALLDADAGLLLRTERGPALVHDADLALALGALQDADGIEPDEAALAQAMAHGALGGGPALLLCPRRLGLAGAPVPVQAVAFADWPAVAGFVREP